MPVNAATINGGKMTIWDPEDIFTNVVPANPQYYVDNYYPDPEEYPQYSAVPPYAAAVPVYNIQYNGTTVFTNAQTFISANVTTHIKIAIADYKDAVLDSAVFIKAWSACQCQ